MIHEGVRRIRALPGVEVAATTCCVPLEDRLDVAFQIAGRPEGPASKGRAGWTMVSAGYFETFKIPLAARPHALRNRTTAGRPWSSSIRRWRSSSGRIATR